MPCVENKPMFKISSLVTISQCAKSCCVFVERYFGMQSTLLTAELSSDESLGMGSAADIVKRLRILGFEASGVQLSPNELSNIRLPAIVHLKTSHFIVAYSSKQGKWDVFDPARGLTSMDHEMLCHLMSGIAVLAHPIRRTMRERMYALMFGARLLM